MNFVIVSDVNGDWQGVYLNDVLITENHRVSAAELLLAMHGYQTDGRIYVKRADTECEDRFPDKLEDVVFV